MTPEEVAQRITNLAEATRPVLRHLQPNAPKDSAGLLHDLDELGNAYHAALKAGMTLAYDWAAEPMTTEEALTAVRRVAEKSPTWEVVGP